MRLDEWIAQAEVGELSRLHRATKLAYTTVFAVAHGLQTPRYETAERLSQATGGAVSIAELCKPRAGRKRSKRRRTA